MGMTATERSRRRRERLRAEGACIDCAAPSDKYRCGACQFIAEARRPQRRASYRSNLVDLVIRDGPDCRGCGRRLSGRDMTIDHVRPQAAGGSDRLDNLQIMCAACNASKGATVPRESAHYTATRQSGRGRYRISS